MTVCIGALCCDKALTPSKAIVVACDRMVTLGQQTEFEHDVPKIIQISKSAVVTMADNTLRAAALVDKIRAMKIAEKTKITDIAAIISAEYHKSRLEEIEKTIFRPRGLERSAFYSGQYGILNSHKDIIISIDTMVTNFNYQVQLLLAGVDDDGAHLIAIHNPGTSPISVDHIGYEAIGSGGLHAVHSLIGFGHNSKKKLEDTVFTVYASKRRAEAAPGVGKETDILFIDEKGVNWLSGSDKIKLLSDEYEKLQKIDHAKTLEEVKKII